MGTSDLFRNLEWQIETYLAPKTIEFLRKNWSWDISPEENLTRAVTSVVPFIFENQQKWGEEMVKRDRESDDDDVSVSDGATRDESDTEIIKLIRQQLQDSQDKNRS